MSDLDMAGSIGIKPNMESQKITTDAYREGWDRIFKCTEEQPKKNYGEKENGARERQNQKDTSVPPVKS